MNFAHLFRESRQSDISVTGKEMAVLSVIRTTGDIGICAADVSTVLKKETGKEPRLATVYSVLMKLEEKNLIESASMSQAGSGGRPRRLFRLTEAGELAIQLGDMMFSKGILV